MTDRVIIHFCGRREPDRACGLRFESDPDGRESIGEDYSYDECHHPWALGVAQEMADVWNTREAILRELGQIRAERDQMRRERDRARAEVAAYQDALADATEYGDTGSDSWCGDYESGGEKTLYSLRQDVQRRLTVIDLAGRS